MHALIEKPLAQDVPSATRLAEAFEAKGLVGAVGHIERYNPALQQARSRIEAGDLGEVYQVVTRRQGPFPARIADVGVVKDLATHDIDLTAWVTQQHFTVGLGPHGPPVRARARGPGRDRRPARGRHRHQPPGQLAVAAQGAGHDHHRRAGALVADTLTADLTFYANGEIEQAWDAIAKFRGVSEGDVIRYAIPKPEPLRVEHEHFRDAVLGKDADIVTMTQGLSTVRVAEAVLQSAATGHTVPLDAS